MAREIVEAPISGKIISVEAKVGAKVSEGDTLCLLESMKMENPILAPVAGAIVEVKVTEGQVVRSGDLIVIIEY